MTLGELSAELVRMYNSALKGESSTMVHLFAIKYADEIHDAGLNALQISKAANIYESAHCEINTGLRLARYVTVKEKQ
jgi:5-methylcytosine-specific restriction protein B